MKTLKFALLILLLPCLLWCAVSQPPEVFAQSSQPLDAVEAPTVIFDGELSFSSGSDCMSTQELDIAPFRTVVIHKSHGGRNVRVRVKHGAAAGYVYAGFNTFDAALSNAEPAIVDTRFGTKLRFSMDCPGASAKVSVVGYKTR